jgi:hypothetical protein
LLVAVAAVIILAVVVVLAVSVQMFLVKLLAVEALPNHL